MMKTLEKRGLILRQPGLPRSLRILIAADEIPPWNNRKRGETRVAPADKPGRDAPVPESPPANLYVLMVFLTGGPNPAKYVNKEFSRVIEIRGDQTLDALHRAIFKAYDRWDEHLYEFQLGKRPFDPAGPNYGIPESSRGDKTERDARKTTLDQLNLKVGRVFGYLFDFGDDWLHQVQVERIDQAIPTVTYPRVVKRVGKSPPQYSDR
jgi:hypothetical protein